MRLGRRKEKGKLQANTIPQRRFALFWGRLGSVRLELCSPRVGVQNLRIQFDLMCHATGEGEPLIFPPPLQRMHARVHIIPLLFFLQTHQDIEPVDFLLHYHCSGNHFLDIGLRF